MVHQLPLDLQERRFFVGGLLYFGGLLVVDGVEVTYPRELYARLDKDGLLDAAAIDRLHRSLASAFPSA
ncbi:hypothetical protein [Aeromicrobium sp. SORGH_AS_0981]|uniref:hypothetical protein n=1 Tax=Aeromicrobium sp. SORGH_AS_0981 TaxID=3041802 RepID=UPI00286B68DE|nr:hypothetical protein [Aeromicrobium sp. SORGH_AS_0981]